MCEIKRTGSGAGWHCDIAYLVMVHYDACAKQYYEYMYSFALFYRRQKPLKSLRMKFNQISTRNRRVEEKSVIFRNYLYLSEIRILQRYNITLGRMKQLVHFYFVHLFE